MVTRGPGAQGDSPVQGETDQPSSSPNGPGEKWKASGYGFLPTPRTHTLRLALACFPVYMLLNKYICS